MSNNIIPTHPEAEHPSYYEPKPSIYDYDDEEEAGVFAEEGARLRLAFTTAQRLLKSIQIREQTPIMERLLPGAILGLATAKQELLWYIEEEERRCRDNQ